MASMTTQTCRCGKQFQARTADVKRGWGKFCSKSCKAKEQEKRTGQYWDYLNGKTPAQKRARKARRRARNQTSSGTFDLSAALARKVYLMDNPVDVEPKEDWDYDGPFSC